MKNWRVAPARGGPQPPSVGPRQVLARPSRSPPAARPADRPSAFDHSRARFMPRADKDKEKRMLQPNKLVIACLAFVVLCLGSATAARADTITFAGSRSAANVPPAAPNVGRCGAPPNLLIG